MDIQKKIRILISGAEICGWINLYSEGFRRLGYPVTTVIKSKDVYRHDLTYDINLEADIPQKKYELYKRLKFRFKINHLIEQHDVFIFLYAGESLRSAGKDYPLIKKLGKRIISVCVGSDIRYWPAALGEYVHLVNSVNLIGLRKNVYKIDRFEGPLRIIEKYSDVILSVPDQSSLAMRPYYHLRVPLNVQQYCCKINDRVIPKVIHFAAPNRSQASKFYSGIISELKNEGCQFEYLQIPPVSHSELKKILEEADIVLDSPHIPGPGALGIESMASGTIVLSNYLGKEYLSPKFHLPIVAVDESNAKEKLKFVIANKEYREDLAKQGRAWVEKMNSCELAAAELIEILEGKHPPDYFPQFYAQNKHNIKSTLQDYLSSINEESR